MFCSATGSRTRLWSRQAGSIASALLLSTIATEQALVICATDFPAKMLSASICGKYYLSLLRIGEAHPLERRRGLRFQSTLPVQPSPVWKQRHDF